MWAFSMLATPWFVPPRDAFGLAVGAAIFLVSFDLSSVGMFHHELGLLRGAATAVSLFVVGSSVASMAFLHRDSKSAPGTIFFRLTDSFGRAEFLLTPPALISVVGYYQDSVPTILFLTVLWVSFVTIRPVETVFRAWAGAQMVLSDNKSTSRVGAIRRVDDPNILRVALDSPVDWGAGLFVATLAGNLQKYCIPLFAQSQDDEIVGTGLCHGVVDPPNPSFKVGDVYRYEDSAHKTREDLLREMSGNDQPSDLVGFVVEGSTISDLRVEIAGGIRAEEGEVHFANLDGTTVFYQVLGATTAEETFEKNPSGKQIANCAQLGTFDRLKGFKKHPWLPSMNHPIFRFHSEARIEQEFGKGEVCIGKIPSTNIGLPVHIGDLARIIHDAGWNEVASVA